MKRSIPIILGMIWLSIIASFAFQDGIEWKRNESMNLCQDGIQVEDRVFVLENRNAGGVIYEIGEDKQVIDIFFSEDYQKNLRISRITYEESLYALMEEAGVYHILELDSQMNPVASSALLDTGKNGKVTGFAADEEGFYLTLISDERDQVYTYFLEKEGSLKKIEAKKEAEEETRTNKEENSVVLRMLRLLEAEEGREIIDARFEEGEYRIRLDDGSGKEHFLLSDTILEAYYQRKLSSMQILKFQREKLIFYGQLLLAGYVFLVAGTVVLRNKRHTVYTLVIVELILLCVTVMGAVLAYRVEKEAKEEQNRIFGEYYLSEIQRQIGVNYRSFIGEADFYTSENYYEVWDELSSFVEEDGPDRLLDSIAIVRCEDYRIMASSSGRNAEHSAYSYSTSVIALIDSLKEGHKTASINVRLEGQPYLVVGVTDGEKLSSDYCFVGMLKSQTDEAGITNIRKYIYFVEVIFLVGSICSVLLILFQDRDLKKLGKAMFLVASGNYEVKKEEAHGRDVKWMWSSLLEIAKRISRINHAKFRLYESCYRFAPKNIEKILGKDSITEVESGDVIELYGTLAMINCAKAEQTNLPTMPQVNQYVELLEKYKEKKDGFFLSGDNDLKSMKMLFLQSCATTMDFAVGFMKEFQKMQVYDKFRTGILLHYDHYRYGIAGTNEQCFSFLFYEKMEKLEKLGCWLETMGIKLVVTETVKKREGFAESLRFIGYILFKDKEERIDLYEVLDACSEEDRKKKQALNSKFQKALEFFYEYDFYLSRSTFSEVLKEHPEDQIAKWYLFTCENYLNQSYAGEVSFELWGERNT